MGIQPMVFCALLGCLISLLIIPLVLLPGLLGSVALRRGTDPAEPFRREHARVLPSLGGIALATSFLGVAALIYFLYPAVWMDQGYTHLAIVWTGLAVFFLGLWDDYRPLGAVRRTLAQTVIAAAAYVQGVRFETLTNPFDGVRHDLGVWSALVTVAWLVGLTNVIHLAGRREGWSGGVAFALAALVALLAVVGFNSGAEFPALCAVGVAGSLLGCMFCNLAPSRVRLGGAGAGFVGFLSGSLITLNPDPAGTNLAAGVLMLALALPGLGLAMALRPKPRNLSPVRVTARAVSSRLVMMGPEPSSRR